MTNDEKKFHQRLGLAIRGRRNRLGIKASLAAYNIGLNEDSYRRLEGQGVGINPWRLEKLARLCMCKSQDLIEQACVMWGV